MGTRCLTVMQREDGTEIAVLYRQMDGYPEGHGKDLHEFLDDMQICNGISSDQKTGKWANGAECLAAQIVAYFKDRIGQFYLHPAGTRNCGEEYIYTVRPSAGGVIITTEEARGY
jgi:hypothetical protein